MTRCSPAPKGRMTFVKKLFCLMLALMLCLTSVVVLAEETADTETVTEETAVVAVPSKTAEDMTHIEVDVENTEEDASGFFIRDVQETEEEYQTRLDACAVEIEKMAAAESFEEYFADATDFSGNAVDLDEALEVTETEELKVYECLPVIAGGYKEEFGKVNVKMLFPTPYEVGQKVMVMIGFVTINEDGTQTVQWIAYDGYGIESTVDDVTLQGCIQTILDPEIVEAIESGLALVAIVSK